MAKRYILFIVLSVLLFTAFDYPFGILVIVLSVLWFTAFDHRFGILVIVLSVCDLRLLITPLVFWSLYFLSVIYCFWLPLWYFGHWIVCLWFTAFDHPFGILVIVLSVLWFTAFDHPFGILVIVLSLLWFTAFDYPFVFCLLYCLSCDLRLLITPLVLWSLYCLSVIYGWWLPHWYFGHCIVCLWFTADDYPIAILVIVLSVCDLLLMITPLIFWSLYCLSVIYCWWSSAVNHRQTIQWPKYQWGNNQQ
jgi:hypothetical protein